MMRYESKDNIATIYLDGRIDSFNAPKLEEEIFKAIDFNATKQLIIDASSLEMISSAGLRIILKIKKNVEDLEIINASSEVYNVFEMTGFTEMMKISKGLREMSLDGATFLAEGSMGIIYRYGNDSILKVYKNENALQEIERERQLARRAFILGIPTAMAFETVKVGDKYGSVFELLRSTRLSNAISSEPERFDEWIDKYVALVKKTNNTIVHDDNLYDVKRLSIDWCNDLKEYLDAKDFNKLLSLITNIPERETLIHGDYHTNNVVVQNDDLLLIDMDTLSFGHPIFELTAMYLAYVGFGELDPSVITKFLQIDIELANRIWKASLTRYFDNVGEEELKQIEDKIKIVAYLRILRRAAKHLGLDTKEGKELADYSKDKLIKLINKYDTLDFDIASNESGKNENEITLPAEIQSIDSAINFVNEKLEALDCPMKIQIQINVAIDELFSNIAHYAYPNGEGDAIIKFESIDNPKTVCITFIDKGVPYNPLEKIDPDTSLSADDREIGGLGIFLVKKSMDDVSYQYRDGQNILTIKKKLI